MLSLRKAADQAEGWRSYSCSRGQFVMTSIHFAPGDNQTQVGQTDIESIGFNEVNNHHLVLPRVYTS